MDDMPQECVEHILSFLPIADVFVCRSVCGKWKGAADSVIRRQKELKFIVVDNNKRTGTRNGIVLRQSEHPVRPDDETPVSLMGCWRTQPHERNASVWTKRLELMVRLEMLTVVCVSFISGRVQDLTNPLKSLINAVIMRNASTLIIRAGGFGKMGVFGACFPKNDPLVPIDFTLEGEEFGA